jgi:SAM-dependent methyltransferase
MLHHPLGPGSARRWWQPRKSGRDLPRPSAAATHVHPTRLTRVPMVAFVGGKDTSSVEHVACILCGSRESEPLLRARDRLAPPRDSGAGRPVEFAVVRCRSCGLAYTEPRPTAEELRTYYPEDYWGRGHGASARPRAGVEARDVDDAPHRPVLLERFEDAYRRRQQREVVRWLGRLRPRRGRLLDVGAGRGDLLAALADDGWRVKGIEPSASAAAVARRRFGLDVVAGTVDDTDPVPSGEEGLFDAVVFAGVVEHLPDPLAALRRARALLAPGAVLAVLFLPRLDSPQARLFGSRWLALDLPRHLYHFDDATWLRLIGAAGLEVEAAEPYSSRHAPPMWVSSAVPALHKHRFYLDAERGERAALRTAKEIAYVSLTTAVRPLCRLEARLGFEGQRSYFLRAV